MKLNYIVKIDNINTPRYKAITKHNIYSFIKLFKNPLSKFSKWYINKKSDILNILNGGKYEITKKLNNYYSMDIFNKSDTMIGGGMVINVLFLLAIVYFIFYRNYTNYNMLVDVQPTKSIMKGGTDGITKHNEIKCADRNSICDLLYIVSIGDNEYGLKINTNKEFTENPYVRDYAVYGQLITNPVVQQNSAVVEYYNIGEIIIGDFGDVLEFNLNTYSYYVLSDDEVYQEIYNSAVHNKIYYIVYKFENDYLPLDIIYEIFYDAKKYNPGRILEKPLNPIYQPYEKHATRMDSIDPSIMLENVLRILIYLYENEDFIIAVNMIGNNILINMNEFVPKLHSFGLSLIKNVELDKRTRDYYQNLLFPTLILTNIVDIGLLYGLIYTYYNNNSDVFEYLKQFTESIYTIYTKLTYMYQTYLVLYQDLNFYEWLLRYTDPDMSKGLLKYTKKQLMYEMYNIPYIIPRYQKDRYYARLEPINDTKLSLLQLNSITPILVVNNHPEYYGGIISIDKSINEQIKQIERTDPRELVNYHIPPNLDKIYKNVMSIKKIPSIPLTLSNLGNTCYINATLQLLNAAYVHMTSGERRSLIQFGGNIGSLLYKAFETTLHCSAYVPELRAIAGMKPGKTEDSSYFLRKLFEHIHPPATQMFRMYYPKSTDNISVDDIPNPSAEIFYALAKTSITESMQYIYSIYLDDKRPDVYYTSLPKFILLDTGLQANNMPDFNNITFQQQKYKVIGMTVYGPGHYVAVVRSSTGVNQVLCNDSVIRPITGRNTMLSYIPTNSVYNTNLVLLMKI